MNTILTIIILLLLGYLIIKYCLKSKKENFGNTSSSVIRKIKQKINMDTLYNYWSSLKQWNKDDPKVIQAYEDQKHEIFYGAYNTSGVGGKYDPEEDYLKQMRGDGKLLWNISELNKWWDSLDDKHNKIKDEVKQEEMRLKIVDFKNTTYILIYKRNLSDALIFVVTLEDPTLRDKDKFQLMYENCPYKENPFVHKSYIKKLKEIMFDYVWSAEVKMMGTKNTPSDIDYFKQIDKDVIDYSESDTYLNGDVKQKEKDFYKKNFDKDYSIGRIRKNKRLGLKKIFTIRLKEILASFIDNGKPSEDSLNSSNESISYYNWLTEYDNYWLRLPEWVKKYDKDKTESMYFVYNQNRKSLIFKMEEAFITALGTKYKLNTLTEFHKKVPPRVKAIRPYRNEFNARFRAAYKEAKGKILERIKETKDRNSLVKFRNKSEKDENYQVFFGISNNIMQQATDANTIIQEFWFRFDDLTKEQIKDTKDTINKIVSDAKPGVSIFFELLREWESMKKTPTKFVPMENSKKFKEVVDEDYKYESWIARLHTDDRVVTKFKSPIDKEIRKDKKDHTVYDLYTSKLKDYETYELDQFKKLLKCEKDGKVIGLGSQTGINNVNAVFNESYFRKFVFDQKEEHDNKVKLRQSFIFKFRNAYKTIVDEWNKKFTEFAVACFPKTDKTSTVEFTVYKARWLTIKESKFFHLITSSNRTKIGKAFNSNPSIKKQVIHELRGIVSLIELEIFINMLPKELQKDSDVMRNYEERIITSVEDDMKKYSTMLFLVRYWVGLKDIFKTNKVKIMFHNIAKKLMEKNVLGILKNKNLGYTLSNTKEGGLWGVREVCVYWERIMIYDIMNDIPNYINMIKKRIKLLLPMEFESRKKVSTLVSFWLNHHKFVRKKFRSITWSIFVKYLELLFIQDMEKFKSHLQYKNLIEYWGALDKLVKGQQFAWDRFFKKFKKFMKEKIEIATSTKELEDEIWKYYYLIKYSSDVITDYGVKYNTLQVEEDMAENVAGLTKSGECPGHHPYAYSLSETSSPNYCCKHDPYFDQPTGKVNCKQSIDCPHSSCYIHTSKYCKKNSDCMSYGDSEPMNPKVKCLKENGSCVYCPLGTRSPVGSPLCQWGNNRPEKYVEPEPVVYKKIMP